MEITKIPKRSLSDFQFRHPVPTCFSLTWYPLISSSSSTNGRKGNLSASLKVSELSYRSASRMCGARMMTDLCTCASSRQCGPLLGRPGFCLLRMGKKSIPSSAQNGLVKADGHQDQEKVLTDQLLSESPLCSLWQLADDRAPHRKGR